MKHKSVTAFVLIVVASMAMFVAAQTNNPPTHENPRFTSTSGRNLNTDDLTCAAVNLTDPENDPITSVFNYNVNGQSWSVVNMPFEPNRQNTARDYSGHNNHGSLQGAAFVRSAVNGHAAMFDGVDDHIAVPYAQSLNLAAPFTIEAWVNVSDLAPTQIILGRGNSTPPAINFAIGLVGGRPSFGFTDESLAGVSVASPEPLIQDQWFHIAGAYDGAKLRIYVNGMLKNEVAYTGRIVTDNTSLFIGGDVPSNRYFFKGLIDEVQMYNRVLAHDQITGHFNRRYDLIKAQQTERGEQWQCKLTPNDGFVDGETKDSNTITVTEPLMNRIYVHPPARKATVNRTFMVEVALGMVEPVFGAQFTLNFDPNLMTALNVTEGGFLRSGNVQTEPRWIINQSGTIQFYNTRIGGANGGVNGTGSLARFTFRMNELNRNVRDGAFDISNVILVDANLTQLSAQATRGTFVIRHLEGDVNNDNRVNVLDLAAVGIAFNARRNEQLYNLDADLIEDDLIDIFDLSLVGINLGRGQNNEL